MIDDIRYTLRQLRKNPGFAAAAGDHARSGDRGGGGDVRLIQGVLLTPPPYADPANGSCSSRRRGSTAAPTPAAAASDNRWTGAREPHPRVACPLYRWTFNFLVLPDGSASLGGMVVTSNFFKTLGVTPVLGREFVAGEASRTKVPPTGIILGYELWQRQFHGDRSILGTAVRISRYPAPLPVVGVMPPGVRFLPIPATPANPTTTSTHGSISGSRRRPTKRNQG